MKIAIQGELGSFHHEAARKLYPEAEILPRQTFRDVFEAVETHQATHGLVAIENNIYGSINETYGLLMEYDMWVAADIRMQIGLCLIASELVELSELQTKADELHVLSQAPALAQAERWLDTHLPAAIRQETADTAGSVKHISEATNDNLVAIAGAQAAEEYGGHVIAEHIEDETDNYTRFIAFIKAHETPDDATDTSIILRTDHTPGALVRALQLFDDAKINLTKLDSHPIPGDKQHYRFYIDFTARYDSPGVKDVFEALKKQRCELKILGCYTRHG